MLDQKPNKMNIIIPGVLFFQADVAPAYPIFQTAFHLSIHDRATVLGCHLRKSKIYHFSTIKHLSYFVVASLSRLSLFVQTTPHRGCSHQIHILDTLFSPSTICASPNTHDETCKNRSQECTSPQRRYLVRKGSILVSFFSSLLGTARNAQATKPGVTSPHKRDKDSFLHPSNYKKTIFS